MNFQSVFVGGTFDGIHKGHEELMRRAFDEGHDVTIGITSDAFTQKYKPGATITSYKNRKLSLEQWLTDHNLRGRAIIIPIDDPFEPAASSLAYQALMVTSLTRERGEKINTIRVSRGLPELTLIDMPLVNGEDGQVISSTRMRGGIIDREGRLVMPEALRSFLSKPLGPILKNETLGHHFAQIKNNHLTIAVGDITVYRMLNAGILPALSIIDLRVNRAPYQTSEQLLKGMKTHEIRVKSGPGYISGEAMQAISDWAAMVAGEHWASTTIVVDGEEDLLVLPALIFAPIGTSVYYGQPNEGLVEVKVTEEMKVTARDLISKFITGGKYG